MDNNLWDFDKILCSLAPVIIGCMPEIRNSDDRTRRAELRTDVATNTSTHTHLLGEERRNHRLVLGHEALQRCRVVHHARRVVEPHVLHPHLPRKVQTGFERRELARGIAAHEICIVFLQRRAVDVEQVSDN